MGNGIFETAVIVFQVYYYVMLFYVISSWIPQLRSGPVGELAGKLVEPYFGLYRKFIPPIGMVDISSLVAFIVYGHVIQPFALAGLKTILAYAGLL